MTVWQPVRDAFAPFTKRFEGWFAWLYEDRLGLMTTGLGNLLDTQPPSPDPTPMCLALPWTRPDGSRASKQDVTAAWKAVRARPDLRPLDGHAYGDVTTIRLSPAAITALIRRRFDENDAILSARFPHYSEWPAEGQLGLHSMAWPLGPRFRFPRFEEAANDDPPDFAAMARQCKIPGGLPLRNSVNAALFQAADAAQREHHPESFAELSLDVSTLFGAEEGANPSGVQPHWGRIAGTAAVAGAALYGVKQVVSHFRRIPRSTP